MAPDLLRVDRVRRAARWSDTFAVLRAMGAHGVGAAIARRVLTTPIVGPPEPAPPEELARALLVSRGPLAPGDDAARLAALERSRPGAAARMRERALAAAAGAAEQLAGPAVPGEDPRLSWDAGRLARLVTIGAGARCAEAQGAPLEAAELRRALGRAACAWIAAHPRGSGATGWESPLEAALRAWNLWVAVSLAGGARALGAPVARRIAASLGEHGRHIAAHLEERGLAVGSHLLGELVGLYACGVALGGAGREPQVWHRRARAGLAREAVRQVLRDGGGAEGSTGYARFVAELLVAALVTARAAQERPPAGVARGAAALLRHLSITTAPDGRDLGIGDDDGSRVLPSAAGDPRDLSGLLSLGPALCGARERLDAARWSEEAAWLAGGPGWLRYQAARPVPVPGCVAAPAFGLYLGRGRAGRDLVAMRAGPHGQGGAGGHAHDDPLSLVVWLDGRPVIVDPGTGLYLGRPALRDRFRGAAAHATVCIDGQEPSPPPETRLFALPDRARARAEIREDGGATWACSGAHEGLRRLGVAHWRSVRLDRVTGRVVVVDRLDPIGRGPVSHEVTLSFPLAVAVARIDGARLRVGPAGEEVACLVAGGDAPLPWRLDPGAVSPRYGEQVGALVARRVGRVALPVTLVTTMSAAGGDDDGIP